MTIFEEQTKALRSVKHTMDTVVRKLEDTGNLLNMAVGEIGWEIVKLEERMALRPTSASDRAYYNLASQRAGLQLALDIIKKHLGVEAE